MIRRSLYVLSLTALLAGGPVLAQTAGYVALDWTPYTQGTTPNYTPASGYNVYRSNATCTAGAAFTKLTPTPLPVSQTTYNDATVALGQTYCYTTKAVDAKGGESTGNTLLTFQVPSALPAAVGNLRGTYVSQ